MNNAWESYCLLIETNPSPLPDTPFVSSFPSPPPLLPFARIRGVPFLRSSPPLQPGIPVLSFSTFSTEPHRHRRSRRAPPNRPVQMRAALSLYPRIKRIVYDKSSGSSLTKRPLARCETRGRPCVYMRTNEQGIDQ